MLYEYQREFLADKSKLRIVNKSRQIGFSTIIANEICVNSLSHNNQTILCVSPSERQAIHLLGYVYSQLRPLKCNFKEQTKTSFELANGSSVFSLPNSPKTVRGYPADAVYIDEFAHFTNDEEMWTAIAPSASRGGRITVCSTPLGERGKFHELYTGEADFSRHEYPHTVCPDLDISLIRKTMDEATFRQEYCCAFLSEMLSFFTYNLILQVVDDSLKNIDVYTDTGQVYIGVDFGKIRDSTVITAVEVGTPSKVIHIKEFLGTKFSEQMEFIARIASRLKAAQVRVDSTGYGIPLLEQAEDQLSGICAVEGVTFTNKTKEAMIMNLKVLFEQGMIRIPRNQKLINQLHTLSRTVSSQGTVRYRHSDVKMHDDFVWSLALAAPGMMDVGQEDEDLWDYEEDDWEPDGLFYDDADNLFDSEPEYTYSDA